MSVARRQGIGWLQLQQLLHLRCLYARKDALDRKEPRLTEKKKTVSKYYDAEAEGQLQEGDEENDPGKFTVEVKGNCSSEYPPSRRVFCVPGGA